MKTFAIYGRWGGNGNSAGAEPFPALSRPFSTLCSMAKRETSRRWGGFVVVLLTAFLPLVAPHPTAAAPAEPMVGVSDGFDGPNLDLDTWTLVDPSGAGRASLVLGGISFAPGGDSWADDESIRVEQTVDDGPFDVVIEVPALPATKYTAVGATVAGGDAWLRIGFTGTGSGTSVVAIGRTNGTPLVRLDHEVDPDTRRLRIERMNSQYVVWTAPESGDWQLAGSFVEYLEVERLALFGATRLPGAEAVAVSDFVAAAPAPEVAGDGRGPLIQSVTSRARGDKLLVSFSTDEAARASVLVGSETYADSSLLRFQHEIVVPEIQNGTTVSVQAIAVDASGNRSETQPAEFWFTSAGLPVIDVWYGDRQVFGRAGVPQQWVNIVGRVSDDDEVVQVTYTIDGSEPIRLRRGPTEQRLSASGDFNVELGFAQLAAGEHEVELKAIDSDGNFSTRTVTLVIERGEGLLLPHSITWSDAPASLNDVAQVVDGNWTVEADGTARLLETGYDRMIAVGDRRWTEYEVVFPVVVHDVDPAGFDPAGKPNLGVVVGWEGHHAEDDKKPAVGLWPSTGAAGISWESLERSRLTVRANGGSPSDSAAPAEFPLGTEVWMRVRVERVGDTSSISAKTWLDGDEEPAGWDAEVTGADDTVSGSIAILAHHVDASIGDILVEPLGA